MTATAWTSDELARVGDAEQLIVEPLVADGRTGKPVPIWVVRAGYVQPMVTAQARATTLRLVPRSEAGA